MMGRKQFSYLNLRIIKMHLYNLFNIYFLRKISKNYSHGIFLKMLLFVNLHPSLYLWTHDMGVGKGILINCKRP